jgi:hypothetical protein
VNTFAFFSETCPFSDREAVVFKPLSDLSCSGKCRNHCTGSAELGNASEDLATPHGLVPNGSESVEKPDINPTLMVASKINEGFLDILEPKVGREPLDYIFPSMASRKWAWPTLKESV